MQVRYKVHRLNRFTEVDLSTVEFEELATCPVCDSPELQDISHLQHSITTAWCTQCCHLFHRRRPTAAWNQQWYSQEWDTTHTAPQDLNRYSSWFQSFPFLTPVRRLVYLLYRLYLKQSKKRTSYVYMTYLEHGKHTIYNFCKPVLGKNSTVLDVGCGYGFDLIPFIRNGCRTYGLEASPHRAKTAENCGVTTKNIPVEQLTAQSFNTPFDLVISNHVLEHVSNPHDFIRGMTQVVKPGQWVSIGVPNIENEFYIQNFFFALHLHCFSRKSLTTLLAKHHLYVHRIHEDFELRVLAQYRPDLAADTHTEERGLHNRLIENQHSTPLAVKDVMANVFGTDSLAPQPNSCFIKLGSEKVVIRRPYSMKVDASLEPIGNRTVEVQWQDEASLPLTFVPLENADAGSPFWVK